MTIVMVLIIIHGLVSSLVALALSCRTLAEWLESNRAESTPPWHRNGTTGNSIRRVDSIALKNQSETPTTSRFGVSRRKEVNSHLISRNF